MGGKKVEKAILFYTGKGFLLEDKEGGTVIENVDVGDLPDRALDWELIEQQANDKGYTVY